jgi:hypothetical protein
MLVSSATKSKEGNSSAIRIVSLPSSPGGDGSGEDTLTQGTKLDSKQPAKQEKKEGGSSQETKEEGVLKSENVACPV